MAAVTKSEHTSREQGYRFDVTLHDALMDGPISRSLKPRGEPQRLPEPVFPRHPELAGDVEPNPRWLPQSGNPYRTRVTPFMVYRTMRGWLTPYIKSRVLPGAFHPIIAYLFTEWKCNLDCHYCWAFDNRVAAQSSSQGSGSGRKL